MSDRSFPPSPQRLALARQAGLVVGSRAMIAGVLCSAALIAHPPIARLANDLAAFSRDTWAAAPHTQSPDSFAAAMKAASASITPIIAQVFWIMLGCLLVAAAARFLQIGPLWTTAPRRAAARLGHPRRHSFAGSVLVAAICIALPLCGIIAALWNARTGITLITEGRTALDAATTSAGAITTSLGWLAAGLITMGLVELCGGRIALRQRLHMTRDEVLREEREQGSPAAGAGVPATGRQWALDMARVPQAAMVLRGAAAAVAIGYTGKAGEVPVVLAAGFRANAGTICDVAAVAGVIIVDVEPELIKDLMRTTPGHAIETASYARVGELLDQVRQQLEASGNQPTWATAQTL